MDGLQGVTHKLTCVHLGLKNNKRAGCQDMHRRSTRQVLLMHAQSKVIDVVVWCNLHM